MTKSQAGRLGFLASLAKKRLHRGARVRIYLENPRKCRACGSVLTYDDMLLKKVFCNPKCRAASGMPSRKKATAVDKNKCLACGSLTFNEKFCNSACCGTFLRAKTLERIEAGLVVTPPKVRAYLINKRGHQCEECRNSTWLGKPIPLDQHHIDGNSGNNNLENLKLLCRNCHALTPTYKGKNRGKGRHSRRQRYQAGKSY